MPVVSHPRLAAAIEALAKACGAPDDEAKVFAECHVRAELRGHHTQGVHVVNIAHQFLTEGIETFGVSTPTVIDKPNFSVIDGNHGVGCVVATRAMNIAIEKARTSGIACVWVRRGGIFSMASNYTLQALDEDMVGVATANGVPFVAPWGGRDPFFSTNPVSLAIPSGKELPIVVDMSAGSFSAGKVAAAKLSGKKMPGPYIVNEKGQYTDDPSRVAMRPDHRIDAGALVSHGVRGFGWNLFVEAFAGILSGMEASYKSTSTNDGSPKINNGQFFVAIDVETLMPLADFKHKVDDFIRSAKANRPAAGFDEVLLPGENAARSEKRYLEDGIPVDTRDWEDFLAICGRYAIRID